MLVCSLRSKMLQDHSDHPPKTRSECANVGLLPEILLLCATDSWFCHFSRMNGSYPSPSSSGLATTKAFQSLQINFWYTWYTSVEKNIRFPEFRWLSSVWSSLTQGSSDCFIRILIIRNRLQNRKSPRSNGSSASGSESMEILEVCKGALASINTLQMFLCEGSWPIHITTAMAYKHLEAKAVNQLLAQRHFTDSLSLRAFGI